MQISKETVSNILSEKFVPILLVIYIFATPVHYLTAVEEITLYLAFFISTCLIFFKKFKFTFDTPLSLPFALFAFWALMGILFAINKPNSIHDFYAHLLKYYVLFFLIINFFETRSKFLFLSIIVVISFTLFSLGGMVYFYGILGKKLFTDRLTNPDFLPYRTYIHVFGMTTALLFFYLEKRLLYKWFFFTCTFINLAATLLSQARSGILAALFSFAFLSIANKKYKVMISVLLALLVLIAFTPIKQRLADGDPVRIGTYFLYTEVIKAFPVSGIGFGMQTYSDRNLNLDLYNSRLPANIRISPPIVSPHNSFLDVGARLGLVGLGIYFYIIFVVGAMLFALIRYNGDQFTKVWGNCLFANFIAFYIQGMFSDTSFGVQVFTQYLLLAMITILWKINKDKIIKCQ